MRCLTPARQAMALRYRPFALALARPFLRRWPVEWTEFRAVAMFALVRAVADFDPAYRVRFGSYARDRIQGALIDHHNALLRRPGPLGPADVVAGRVLSIRPDPPVGAALESADWFNWALADLPPKAAALCRAIYLRDAVPTVAGRALGISKSHTWLLHQTALDQVRTKLETAS